MLRNLKYKVDSNESIRKLRRYIDGHVSYRKLFIILLLVTIILLYFGPKIIGYFTTGEQTLKGKYCQRSTFLDSYNSRNENEMNVPFNVYKQQRLFIS